MPNNLEQRILVIIPVYNEEQNIKNVIEDLRENASFCDILVIDDGSVDNTYNLLKQMNVNTIRLPYNLGYGAALQTGFKYASKNDYDIVVQFDGDGQHDAKEIKRLISELNKKGLDIVIGSRFLEGCSYKLSLARKIGIDLFRAIAKFIIKQNISDVTSGFQALKRNVFEFYSKKGNYPCDFPDADIIIFMKLSGFKISEIPVNMFLRKSGRSMHSGLKTVKYVLKLLLSILVVVLQKKKIALREKVSNFITNLD